MNSRRFIANGLVLLMVLGLSGNALAGGLPTLKTITIDGDLADWQEVLVNPVQVSHDGDGSSYGSSCVGSPDRDCEVTGGTGRDLLTFAWTYDLDNVYMYIERWGSSANNIKFYFIMDLDGDAMAQATDRVVRVKYFGSSRRTELSLFAYIPDDPAGDSLIDIWGFVDGYDMPGNINKSNTLYAHVSEPGGSVDGLMFEEYLPWDSLNQPAGAPILWHVACGNNDDLTGVVDNIGGPDGGLGSFGFGGVDISPDWVVDAGSPDVISLAHSITNVGNVDGRFDLQGTSTLGLSLTYWSDPNGDGFPSDGTIMGVDANGDGDFDDASDIAPAGSDDSNSNGLIDFVIPSLGGQAHLVVEISIPSGLDGSKDYLNLKVQKDNRPSINDMATDVIYIGNIVVYPDGDRVGMEGEYVYFTQLVANNQGIADTADFSVLSSQGWEITLHRDVNSDGVPDGLLAVDNDGNGSWDAVAPGADTNGNGEPDTGVLQPGANPTAFILEVAIPLGTAEGTVDITTLTAASPTSGYSGMATNRTTVQKRVTLEPDYLFSAGTNLYYGGEGESVYFAFVLTNAWILEDDFLLSTTSLQGWPVLLWSDPDGNGSIDDGSLITGPVSADAMGGTYRLVAEVLIPAGTPIGTQETITVTADSLSSDAEDTAIGQLEVRMLQTFRDPLYQFQATNFATCETIYIKAGGLEVGQVGRYEIRYFDPSAQPAGTDPLTSDARGQAYTSRPISRFADQGAWTIELWDSVSGLLDQIFVRHERIGLVDPIWIIPGVLVNGADLHILVGLTNQNYLAPFSESSIRTVVRSPDGSLYLTEDGTFQPYLPGSSTTKISPVIPLAAGGFTTAGFTISSVNLPVVGSGNYIVEVYWRTGCLAEIDQGLAFFTSSGCALDADCDDLDFCNGQETCNTSIGACQDGPPPVCDDGYDCTIDSCDSVANACDFVPNHNLCSDSNLCTEDTCDPAASSEPDGCVHDAAAMDGQPCADSFPCTIDACSGGLCVATPDNDACDDSVDCTDDSCSPGMPGADSNGCLFIKSDQNCDDFLLCTLDVCDPLDPGALANGCVNTPDDAGCDDAQDCTTDSCDPTDPGADTNGCVLVPDHDVCDDSSICTTELCAPVQGCVYTPVADGLDCGDNDVCNGDESCQAGVCAPGTPLNCSDSNVCTNDWCNSVLGCRYTYNTGFCSDNLFCTGTDTCDGAGNCSVHSGSPCGNLVCDEDNDTCLGCLVDTDCPSCTQCLAGVCENQASGADLKDDCPQDECQTGTCDGQGACLMVASGTACGDGTEVECNHADTCDGNGNCRPNIDPAGAPCGDQGIECLVDDSCDGAGVCVDRGFSPTGTACGDPTENECDHADSCDTGVCLPNQEPGGTACGDTSESECDQADSCQAGACQPNLSPVGATCGDQGIDCLVNDACDGTGNCVDGGVTPDGGACGDATEADCDHADTCQDGICQSNLTGAGSPCGDQGVDCLQDDACDGLGACLDAGFAADGSACGDPSETDCNHADSCMAGACQANLESDGMACGDSSSGECDGPDSCLAGVCDPNYLAIWTPCGDQGVECLVDDACDGAGSCTDYGFLPDGIACGDPGEAECDLPDTCLAGLCSFNNLAEGTACGDQAVKCLVDDACDDAGNCVDAGFEPEGTLCEDPQDTLFCDGDDTCDAEGTCLEGSDPCPGLVCDEATDACVNCADDDECDDGLFCNGEETCDQGTCLEGDDPCDDDIDCTDDSCNESNDSCENDPDDSQCDDDDVCTEDSCREESGCTNTFQDADLDGVCDALDPCPDDPDDKCEEQDSDGDGIPDDEDPCPDDPTNTCDQFVTGGGCGCTTGRGYTDWWISLAMLTACVLGLGRRRRRTG